MEYRKNSRKYRRGNGKSKNIPIVYIQHIAKSDLAPFFNEGTKGSEIHPRILEVYKDAKIVLKSFADSFYKTNLEKVLMELGATEILVCGMMTQNCVTHTAISKSA